MVGSPGRDSRGYVGRSGCLRGPRRWSEALDATRGAMWGVLVACEGRGDGRKPWTRLAGLCGAFWLLARAAEMVGSPGRDSRGYVGRSGCLRGPRRWSEALDATRGAMWGVLVACEGTGLAVCRGFGCVVEGCLRAFGFVGDGLGLFCPAQWFGAVVPVLCPLVDGVGEFGHGDESEHSPTTTREPKPPKPTLQDSGGSPRCPGAMARGVNAVA